MPAARSPSTAQAVSSGEDARPCSAKPRTKQTSANGSRRRRNGAASAPTAPQPPHASICHGVQGPWPRTKFEASAAIPPTATPARSPSATPAATVITVTGWTPGTAAKRMRPAAAAPASVATSATSFAEPGPDSSQSAPPRRTPPATRRSASAPSSGPRASQRPRAHSPGAAVNARALGNERLASRVEADDAIRHRAREDEVVGDDEGGATRGLPPQPVRQLRLPLRVDAARRLVQDEQVRLGHGHGGEGEALALAAREVARMSIRGAGEPDGRERPSSTLEVASDAERDLLVGLLRDEVPAGILRQVAGATVADDVAGLRLEQAGRELRERPLPRAVRP